MLTNGVRGELDPATDIEMLDEEQEESVYDEYECRSPSVWPLPTQPALSPVLAKH